MRNPLLLPAAAFATGIVFDHLWPFRPVEAAWPALALATLAVLAAFTDARAARIASTLLACAFAGAFSAAAHRPPPPPSLNADSGETILLSGCVAEPPATREDSTQAVLELAPQARVRINLKGDGPVLQYGQQIEVLARVRYPRNFGNSGAFDYRGWLRRQDIYWTASAKASDLRLLGSACGDRIHSFLFGLRTAASHRIAEAFRGDEYKTAILQALLVGDSARLEKVWTEHFRRTGTYHALVISGLHISLLAGMLLFLLRMCWAPPAFAMAATGALAWLYATVSGGQAPVTRAAAGFTLFLIARFFFRRGRILNLLAAVALIFLAVDPEQLFEASFQLSFLSVACIGAFAAPLIERTSAVVVRAARSLADEQRDVHFDRTTGAVRTELRLIAETLGLVCRIQTAHAARVVTAMLRVAAVVFDSLAVSLAVQVGLALPMIYYFHRISVSGLSANLLVVPVLNAAVITGFVTVFTGLPVAAQITGALVSISQAVVDWHAKWEPEWRIPDPPIWLAAAAAVALIAAASASRARRMAVVASGALLALACTYPQPRPSPVLEVSAIDVGQGDSLLVTFPAGQRMLIDGGGLPVFGKVRRPPSLDIGEDVVSPYLWNLGIRQVDVIVSTHGHEDHAGGLPALIRNFRPREIWSGGSPPDPRVPAKALRAGAPFQYGGATVQVLAPSAGYDSPERADNRDSLVMLLTYGKHRFLLTGDTTREVEWEMLDSHRIPHVDVLKIAHHGSRNSTTDEFLRAAGPRIALLSVGAENLYGLPSRDTLARLDEHHVTLLRTDVLGRSTVRSDGERLTFSVNEWEPQEAPRYSPF